MLLYNGIKYEVCRFHRIADIDTQYILFGENVNDVTVTSSHIMVFFFVFFFIKAAYLISF